MSDITPTPAQRVALEAVRDGKVERYYPPHHGYRRSAAPRWRSPRGGNLQPRQDTLDRVQRSDWIRVGVSRGRDTAPVELTDAGREALACHS